MSTTRHQLVINRPAGEVWNLVSDPSSLERWFPGVVASPFHQSGSDEELDYREVELASGIRLREEIVTNDPLIRRFQYRIAGGLFRHHLATIDVIALDDASCMVVYGTDAVPGVMALVLGGASEEALQNICRIVTGEGAAR